jgi:hypothetical protein
MFGARRAEGPRVWLVGCKGACWPCLMGSLTGQTLCLPSRAPTAPKAPDLHLPTQFPISAHRGAVPGVMNMHNVRWRPEGDVCTLVRYGWLTAANALSCRRRPCSANQHYDFDSGKRYRARKSFRVRLLGDGSPGWRRKPGCRRCWASLVVSSCPEDSDPRHQHGTLLW